MHGFTDLRAAIGKGWLYLSGPSGEVTNSVGMKLKLIPAGEFDMGSPDSDVHAFCNEKPQHRVLITQPFYLGIHEVTCGQFRRFVEATRHQTDAEKDGRGGWGLDPKPPVRWFQSPEFTWRYSGFDPTDDHPVQNVSWNDATAFCEWLSRREGQTYRLPTEAEWEYACRAGTRTSYHSGDDRNTLAKVAKVLSERDVEEFCNWGAFAHIDRRLFPAPVGRFPPNAFGLYDMHGNVSEWCPDWYADSYYQWSPGADPQGPGPEHAFGYRVVCGGSGFDDPVCVRSAFRYFLEPESCSYKMGFRVARVPSRG